MHELIKGGSLMCTGGSQKRIDGPHSVKYSPEKWQLGAYVKIGYFETDADLLYQDEIHGSILEQIDNGEFDLLIRFENDVEDPYYYCFKDEGCHIIYHRFLPEDYADFGF